MIGPDGSNITEKTEIISQRERTPANKAKVEAMKAFLDVIGDEDVDAMFRGMFGLAQELSYKLQANPDILLQQINAAHG